MKTLIIIPSRLSATRLPGKPLLKINDISIISHVFNKAKETNIGEVIVAAEDQEIVNDVKNNGGNAILTSDKHKTGTDRIYEAYQKLNLDNIDFSVLLHERDKELFCQGQRIIDQNRHSDILNWHLGESTWQFLPIPFEEELANPNYP